MRIASLAVLTWLTWLTCLGGCLGALGDGPDVMGGTPDPDPDPTPDPTPVDQTTWHEDVAPIVAAHCQTCHQAGGIGPFSVETYAQAYEYASLMASRVESGEMPPWDAVATDDCSPRLGWREDPRLTEVEIATIRAWVDDGAPEGDAAGAAPLPELPDSHLLGVTGRVGAPTSYVTSGDNDEMICFLMDPNITQLSWLTGLEFFPGNMEVVHHVTLSAVPPAVVPGVQARVNSNGWFNCFGGVGIEGLYALGVWVPGSMPFDAGADTGIPVAAGTQVLMQIHYHPAGHTADPDLTEVAMRLTTTPPAHNLLFGGVGNAPGAPQLQPDPDDRLAGTPEFRIPADTGDHVESMRFSIAIEDPRRFPIMAVFPHMHYVGYDLEARITRASPAPGEPSEECLFKTPHWNFDWQRTYFYDADVAELPTVGNGDTVTITCRYDNTMNNSFVQRGLLEAGLNEPIDVFLGEQTLDEMCLAAFAILF